MSKKRKEPLGPFAGVDRLPSQGLPSDALGVLGTKITPLEDASGTISLAVEKNLLLLGNDKDNLVDRFDVRLLLDDISGVTPIRPTSASVVADQDAEEELDEERYADLVHEDELDAADIPTASADATTLEHGGGYQAVGLSYGEDSVAPEASKIPPHFDPAFDVPPEHQHAMRGMLEQQHKVMMQTAKFVRQEGDQLELVLRIRQGHNASFSFLRPDSPLYDYYRWLVQAQPQAREEGQHGSPSATLTAHADEKEHEEPGGALSHLVSMYGASQEVSHDDAGSPSPEGDEIQRDAREADCNPTSAPPADQGAKDHPVRERPSQPEEAPPTAGSAEQGHGRRDVAGGEGCEVTERPARQAERAEQPPAEVQGIVAKLLAFVKKSGVKFEASIRKRESRNPRFGFLLPGHPFHGYYREQIMAVLGEGKAAELLATLPAETITAGLQQSHTAPRLTPVEQAPGEPVQVTIRSNPSLARIAFARRQTPLAKAASTGNTEAGDAQEPDQASAGTPMTSGVAEPEGAQAGADDGQDAGKRRLDGSSSDDPEGTESARDRNESPGLSDLIMEGDADQDAQRAGAELARAFDQGQGLEAALQAAADADARKADEALKAERRRLAMQLLAARRSEAEKARREERGAPTAQAIARHRLALLAEESESQDQEAEEEAEAGEITVAKPDNFQPGAQVRVASLPKLEEVIRPPPPKQESSSEEVSSSSGADDRSQHGLNGRGSRSMQSSPKSGHRVGSPRKEHRVRRSAGRSSERSAKRKRRRSAAYSSEEDSSGNHGRHRRKLSSHSEHRRPKRSCEDTERDKRRKHKRLKHKKDAGGKEEEHHLSQGKALDEPGSSKSAVKQRRKREEKRHDWGNTRPEVQQRVACSELEDQGSTVSVSEVPDALRARIKAMLARS